MPQYEVCFIINQLGWAYAHRAQILQKYSPPDFQVKINLQDEIRQGVPDEDFDLIFLLDYSQVKRTREAIDKYCNSKPIFVSSFNTGWPRRLDYFEHCMVYADAVIINNREYYEKVGCLPNTYHISNGVDLSVFKPLVKPEKRKPKILWCGGILGTNKNRSSLKGYEEYLVPLAEELLKFGIETDLYAVDPHDGDWQRPTNLRSQKEMVRWYNSGTIYVCASEVEGTPNPALEAAACGLALVSTPVGNMPEFIKHDENGYLVERSVKALVDGVLKANRNYLRLSKKALRSIQDWDWRERSLCFFNLFRRLINERRYLKKVIG